MALARLVPRPSVRPSPAKRKGTAHPQVIALANQKGGVAKTTTTLNLGVALAEEGKRVLAIDLDPQGNLTMSQGWNPDEIDRSMFDVLCHRLPITEIVRTNELDVAVSSIDLAGAELALSSMIGRERALEKALLPVREEYDWIMIDTPPSLGLLTINAFVAATGVIVPVQCEYLSLRGLVQLENTLTMIRENLNPQVEIQGILPTMFDKRLLHSREAVEILKENFGDRIVLPVVSGAGKFARRVTPLDARNRIERKLLLAGSPAGWDAERVLAFKIIGAVAGFVLSIVLLQFVSLSSFLQIIVTALLTFVGFVAMTRCKARRSVETRGPPLCAGSDSSRIDGCKAATPHSTYESSQNASSHEAFA